MPARLECVTAVADLEKGKEVLVRLHHARWAGASESAQTGESSVIWDMGPLSANTSDW